MQSYQRLPGNALLRGFRVSYKRHVLTMDDLQTLYGPNWLNDQVGGAGGGPQGRMRGSGGSWGEVEGAAIGRDQSEQHTVSSRRGLGGYWQWSPQ